MRVLCFDPSGNFEEGEGTTGWALYEDRKLVGFGEESSALYDSPEKYWAAVGAVVGVSRPNVVVCESYRLQASKAMAQAGSNLETPQLIGYLRMLCYLRDITFIFQHPQDKVRVADDILVRLGVFEKKDRKHYCMGRPTNDHMRDAIRHGYFYHHYGKGKHA